jgi:hypothetical protein
VAVAALTGVIYAVRPKAAAGPVEAAVTEIEHVHGLAVDPFDPTVLWIGTHVSLIRVRNGLEWLRVGRPHYDMMGFNVHPKEPNVLLTSGHPGPGDRRPNPLGVEISRDGGQTWQPLALVGQADFHAMTIGRADPKMLYGWNVSGRTGLYRSREGGRTWEYLGDRGLERVFYLAVHPERSTTVFAGTGHGFMISEDAGTTWRIFLSAQLFSAPVTAVEAHPKDPRIMYAYAMRLDLGLVRSEDGGRQWTPVGFYPGERDAVSNFALDPTNSQVLYFATFSGDVYRSRDGAKTWDRWVTRGRVTATAGP